MKDLHHFFQQRTVLIATAAVLAIAPLAAAQQGTAKVHGKITNPVGQPLDSGQVKLTTELTTPFKDEKFSNTVDIGKDGTYSLSGVKPGEYFLYVVQGDKVLDRMQQVIKADQDATVDFDMTRAAYMEGLTPAERKSLEEYKAKNAAAVAGNKTVASLNATMAAVRADLKSPSPNYDKDIADSKSAVDLRPTEPLLQVLLGDALYAKAEHDAATDRQNKTNPMTDDAVKGGYASAVDAYNKAVDLSNADPKKPNPTTEATIYNQLGNALAKEGKLDDASAAYDKAAGLVPANAGTYYGNEAATFFNAHQDQPALTAANKAIAADPTKPMPYYIKGQTLLAQSQVDSKTGKIVPPAGCVEAYQKYLEIAPDGPEAASVKDALGALGQKVETHYSAGKKGH